MPTNKPRFTITFDEEMFQAIEDFRFERRFKTQSKAVTELIRLGLEVIEAQKK